MAIARLASLGAPAFATALVLMSAQRVSGINADNLRDAGESISSGSLDAAAAQRPSLVYDDASLAVVVADINRHFGIRISFDGGDTAALKFSGVLALDTVDKVVARLATFLPLDVVRNERGEIILRRRQGL